MPATVSNRALVGVAVAIAIVCTLPVLGHRSLWQDEGFSVAYAHLDLRTLFDAVHHRDAPEFAYYAFLHEWLSLVGTRAELLRLPSALAAIAVVPLTYLVAKELLGTRTALVASFLVAPNFFIVNMAEQARPYTLALFFCVLATYCFLKLLQRPSIPRIIAYAAAAFVAIVLHAFSGLMIIAHVASVPLLTDDVRHVRVRLFASYLLLGLALVPFALLLKSAGMHQIDFAKPDLADVGRLFGHFINRPDKPSRTLVMVFAPCCFAVIAASGAERRRVGALIIWTILPILTAFAISSWKPMFEPRYLFISVVPLFILIGRGLAAIPNGWIVTALTAVFVIAELITDWKQRADEFEDYRSVVRFVQVHATKSDAVVVAPNYFALPYRAAQEELSSNVPRITDPPSDWRFWLLTNPDDDIRAIPASALSGRRRLWLIRPGPHMVQGGRTGIEVNAAEDAIRYNRLVLRRTVYFKGWDLQQLQVMEFTIDTGASTRPASGRQTEGGHSARGRS
jgi:mannosyltransferase